MSHANPLRVKETTTTTGTGTLTLAGAATGFRTFAAGVGNTNTTPYVLLAANGTDWEVGVGTVTTGPDTLARTSVLASTNANAAINLAAGTHTVFAAAVPGLPAFPKSAAATISTGTVTFDLAAARVFTVDLNATIDTIAFTNTPPTGHAWVADVIFTDNGGTNWFDPGVIGALFTATGLDTPLGSGWTFHFRFTGVGADIYADRVADYGP